MFKIVQLLKYYQAIMFSLFTVLLASVNLPITHLLNSFFVLTFNYRVNGRSLQCTLDMARYLTVIVVS